MSSRNIKKGEVIFQEKPLVFGPGDNTCSAICFSCGGIPRSHCTTCNVALICGPECTGNGHSEDECKLYKSISQKLKCTNFITNKIVLPLRCFLNLNNSDHNWINFFKLESHMEKRRGTFIWKINQQDIIQVSTEFCSSRELNFYF